MRNLLPGRLRAHAFNGMQEHELFAPHAAIMKDAANYIEKVEHALGYLREVSRRPLPDPHKTDDWDSFNSAVERRSTADHVLAIMADESGGTA